MATILAAESAVRNSIWMIDPTDIKLGTNGRAFSHDDTSVSSMADSFEKEGQLSDVIVRKLADNSVELVFGFRRHAAAILYNKRHPDNPMKLRCKLVVCNEEEALVKNIAENDERINTGPVDKAYQQRLLRERHGWPDTRIAELYKGKDGKSVSPSYLSQLAKLLLLPSDKQRLVNSGDWSVKMAVDFLNLSKSEQDAILSSQPDGQVVDTQTADTRTADAQGGQPGVSQSDGVTLPGDTSAASSNGTPKKETLSQRIAKKVRDKKIETGGAKSRTMAEVRKFFGEIKAEDESDKEAKIVELAKAMNEFLAGKITDRQMSNQLVKLFS